MEQINLVTRNAIDHVDRLPGLVYKHHIAFLVAITFCIMLYFIFRRKGGLISGASSLNMGDVCEEKAFALAKYLSRESAKLIAVALEKRSSRLYEAYESATQAVVMARLAKEVDPNTDRLSTELGVDFLEYITYTGNVLAELRARMMAS